MQKVVKFSDDNKNKREATIKIQRFWRDKQKRKLILQANAALKMSNDL